MTLATVSLNKATEELAVIVLLYQYGGGQRK
jgi:hypothetical protein